MSRSQFIDIGIYRYDPAERTRFFTGELLAEWHRTHHDVLFDDHDRQFAAGLKLQQGKSWHEWKAAVLLHELTGYHALVTRYQEPQATRKRRLLESIASPELHSLLVGNERPGKAQGPDLIMFDPRVSRRWFFCETKKSGEKFTPSQLKYFPELIERSGRPVFVLTMEAAIEPRLVGEWSGRPSAALLT